MKKNVPLSKVILVTAIALICRNTDYVIAPEECLADNFSYTIVYGFDGKDYQTPQLITDIYNLLCNYNLEN